MVSLLVRRSKISGSIRCPSSKSYTHRAIAIASLAPARQTSTIMNPLLARDTLATVAACRALGTEIQHKDGTLLVRGQRSFDPPDNVINAENSGTTIRIMAAMASLVRRGYTVLTGDESLRKRPMQPILDALGQLGVEAHSTQMDGTPPLIIKGGGMKGGTTMVDGSISSQFISGILISGIYADSEVTMKINDNLVSKPYVIATLATMEVFGVQIEHSPDMLEYNIRNSQYKAAKFEVPSDFSTAALLLAAGALVGEKIKVKGLNFAFPQGDSHIIEILKRMGCRLKVDRRKGEVSIYESESLEGGEFNLADTPDLLPVVCILSLKAKTPVTVTGVSHARVKETDRISNIASELVKFGARIKEFRDGLRIAAPGTLKNASLEAYNDHRLFMAFTIASMMTERSVVAGAESVDVSYPNFISDMKRLGARFAPAADRE